MSVITVPWPQIKMASSEKECRNERFAIQLEDRSLKPALPFVLLDFLDIKPNLCYEGRGGGQLSLGLKSIHTVQILVK